MTYTDFLSLARQAGLKVTERDGRARITGRGLAAPVNVPLKGSVPPGLVRCVQKIAALRGRG